MGRVKLKMSIKSIKSEAEQSRAEQIAAAAAAAPKRIFFVLEESTEPAGARAIHFRALYQFLASPLFCRPTPNPRPPTLDPQPPGDFPLARRRNSSMRRAARAAQKAALDTATEPPVVLYFIP